MRIRPRLWTACLLVAAPLSHAQAEEKLSQLTAIDVATSEDEVVVEVRGSRAPNFTSFTMEGPFRVVVDWAGSTISDAASERTYERGLVRRVMTRQFDSEAEKISRVMIELAQRTTYRVEAKGTTVRVVLDPVPDPLPAPEPAPVVATDEDDDLAAIPPAPAATGPLTEPDVPIPTAPPPMPAPTPTPVAVAVASAPAPASAAPTKVVPPAPAVPAPEPDVPVPVVDEEPAAVAVVNDAEPAGELAPAAEPVVSEAVVSEAVVSEAVVSEAVVSAAVVEPVEPVEPPVVAEAAPAAPGEAVPVVAEAPAAAATPEPVPVVAEAPAPALEPAPVVAEAPAPKAIEPPAPAPEPEAAPVVAEAPAPVPVPVVDDEPAPAPVRLATFEPALETNLEPDRAPRKKAVAEAKVEFTPPSVSAPRTRNHTRTQQLAAAVPAAKPAASWSPPAVSTPGRHRTLPVVKIAKPQEALQPESSTSADIGAPEPVAPKTMPVSVDDKDFDPGPRVMKYIGFRQMAQTSRVFVRMDGKARYKLFQSGEGLALQLLDTSVPIENNTRALDTSYFNSPVLRVQAVPTGDDTRIEIKLRENVSPTIKRIGTTIAIDFSRAP